MFIQTERTPNPSTLKFLPGLEVSTVPAEYRVEDAPSHPFLMAVFVAAPVDNVLIGRDFVSVTLARGVEWQAPLKKKISAAIRQYLGAMPAPSGTADKEAAVHNATVDKIVDILETRVRPAVASDGGDIVFKAYSDGVLNLSMKGACSGCPSSAATLKHGVMSLMRLFVPEVREVRAT